MTQQLTRTELRADVNDPERLPAWVRRWGPALLITGLVLYAVTTGIWLLAYSHQTDMQVYRFGAQELLHGRPLYDHGLNGDPHDLLFNYPPFAALVFVPLTAFPVPILMALIPIANLALVVVTIRRCWQAMGIREDQELVSLTTLCTGALLWLEPVRSTIALGQVGLLLLAVAVFDLLPLRGPRRWSGVGVGLAAGIKLTPLLFIPYLLITRRTRAAAIATVTFLGTIAAGFVIAPSQATEYWFRGTFHDLHRIASAANTGNETLHGAVARMHLSSGTSAVLWITLAVAVASACLAVAAAAHARGDEVFAIAVVGIGSAAVSPYSWPYQWIWFVPLAVYLAFGAIIERSRAKAAGLALVCIATGSWIVELRSPYTGQLPPSGIISLHPGGAVEVLTRNAYLIVLLITLVLAASSLRRREST